MIKRSLAIGALALVSAGAFAQISFNGTYSEDFNTWPKEDDPGVEQGVYLPWTNNSTKVGWYQSVRIDPDYIDRDRITIGVAGSGQYMTSIGDPFSSERAVGTGDFGFDTFTDLSIVWGFRMVNDTNATIDALDLNYRIEHWRRAINGDDPAVTNVTLGQYRVGGDTFESEGFTNASQLNLVSQSPMQGGNAGSSLQNGNLAENQTLVSTSLSGLNWAPGQSLWVRWLDPNEAGRDATLAIDDLSIQTGSAPVPEPATILVLLPALALLRRKR